MIDFGVGTEKVQKNWSLSYCQKVKETLSEIGSGNMEKNVKPAQRARSDQILDYMSDKIMIIMNYYPWNQINTHINNPDTNKWLNK